MIVSMTVTNVQDTNGDGLARTVESDTLCFYGLLEGGTDSESEFFIAALVYLDNYDSDIGSTDSAHIDEVFRY
jgi:hypothetical protein